MLHVTNICEVAHNTWLQQTSSAWLHAIDHHFFKALV